jgi:hypothetical protein
VVPVTGIPEVVLIFVGEKAVAKVGVDVGCRVGVRVGVIAVAEPEAS